MTTGNSAAMTVNAGAVKPPDFDEDQCRELHKRNAEERRKATRALRRESDSRDSKAVDSARDKAEGGGMTFSSAKVAVGMSKGGNISGVATGCSSGKAAEYTSGSLVDGGNKDMRSGQERVLCGYQHAEGGSGSHGESKILNEMTEMAKKKGSQLAGGSILFNVNWRYNASDGSVFESGMPCRLCYRAMCAAADCGIEIHLCDKNNQPQPFDPDGKCKEEGGKDPSKDPYDGLDRRMGEDPKKGRRKVG